MRAFCGLVNFYGRFIRNIADILSPLYKLLQKNAQFKWNSRCAEAVDKVKRLIASDCVLCHFDPSLPIVLACDASNNGVGAVLSHRFKNGVTRPIAFASRTLAKAEQNYSTIHKEALAIIFGVKRFYQYLAGCKFTLQTDHKPLIAIFRPSNGLPVMAAGRIQRWAEFLTNFDYEIEHVKSSENVSDAWSRLPIPAEKDELTEEKKSEKARIYTMTENFSVKNLSNSDVKRESRNDTEISKVMRAVERNNLSHLAGKFEFKPYCRRGDELSIEHGTLMWGARIVIPKKLRRQVLKTIHESHMGIVKSKSLCRTFFWWPNIDADLELLIKSCDRCCRVLPDPKPSQLIPWRAEQSPWARIHLDYAGPIGGFYLLVVVDAFSKWIEVETTKSPSAKFTVHKLRQLMSRYGLPETIVTDNGTAFKNFEFEQLTKELGIEHIFTAPGFPATNGQAESAVKIIKKGIKTMTDANVTKEELSKNICKILSDYRVTQQTTTGESPAKLFLKRQVKHRLDLLRPPTQVKIAELKKKKQIEDHKSSTVREFAIQETVWSRDFSNPNRKVWTPGTVVKIIGRRTYVIRLSGSGRLIKRHTDQLRKRNTYSEDETDLGTCPNDAAVNESPTAELNSRVAATSGGAEEGETNNNAGGGSEETTSSQTDPPNSNQKGGQMNLNPAANDGGALDTTVRTAPPAERYLSTRSRRKPDRLGY